MMIYIGAGRDIYPLCNAALRAQYKHFVYVDRTPAIPDSRPGMVRMPLHFLKASVCCVLIC